MLQRKNSYSGRGEKSRMYRRIFSGSGPGSVQVAVTRVELVAAPPGKSARTGSIKFARTVFMDSELAGFARHPELRGQSLGQRRLGLRRPHLCARERRHHLRGEAL